MSNKEILNWLDSICTLVTGESCPTTIEKISYIEWRTRLLARRSLEDLAIEVREVIYLCFPEYAEKYQGELIHSPAYVFSIAELICMEQGK